ncbi:MAG: hypothetical protein HY909_06975 [Deltaproteobacteria bacterium]|nr:hypothetical protein [Deltaproteobacteria bacterium]
MSVAPCPQCGRPADRARGRFCLGCGEDLEDDPPTPARGQPTRPPPRPSPCLSVAPEREWSGRTYNPPPVEEPPRPVVSPTFNPPRPWRDPAPPRTPPPPYDAPPQPCLSVARRWTPVRAPEAPAEVGPPDPARLLQPARPDLPFYRAALADLRSPFEAWERAVARGWISEEESARPDRTFLALVPCEACGGQPRGADTTPCLRCMRTGQARVAWRAPSSVALCAALVADLDGVRRAEELAREAVARFARAHEALTDGGSPVRPQRVLWSAPCIQALGMVPYDRLFQLEGALGAPRGGRPEPSLPLELDAAVRWRLQDRLRSDMLFHDRWRDGALPNPYEPLLALWDTGYAMVSLNRERIGLLAPC